MSTITSEERVKPRTKRYRLIPELTDYKVLTLDGRLFLTKEMAAILVENESLINLHDRSEKCSLTTNILCSPVFYTFNHVIKCLSCLRRYEHIIAANKFIPSQIIKGFCSPDNYSFDNPQIWDIIKSDETFLESISKEGFADLCRNPKAIHYIESHPEKIDEKCLYELADNPFAFNFMLAQYTDKLDLLIHTGYRPQYFPYFDMEMCRKILCGDTEILRKIRAKVVHHMFVQLFLIHNPAAKYLVEENLPDIIATRLTSDIREIICRKKHLIDMIIKNIDLFSGERHTNYLNLNEAAIPYLTEHPEKIRLHWLVSNPQAGNLLERHVLENLSEVMDVANNDLLISINKNPSMVSFLRTHPELITEAIFANPNIFEEIAE